MYVVPQGDICHIITFVFEPVKIQNNMNYGLNFALSERKMKFLQNTRHMQNFDRCIAVTSENEFHAIISRLYVGVVDEISWYLMFLKQAHHVLFCEINITPV